MKRCLWIWTQGLFAALAMMADGLERVYRLRFDPSVDVSRVEVQ